MLSNLVGRIHIMEIKNRRQMFADDEFYVYPEQAIKKLARRLNMTADQFYALDDYARNQAFTSMALTNDTLISNLRDILEATIANGGTKQDFLKGLNSADLLDSLGLGSKNWYWETVQRTNTMAAYNGGRWQQIQEVKEDIVALEYIGIDDVRQSEICEKLDGITLPPDDPFWDTYTPPNHFNCRSTVRPVFKGTTEAENVKLSAVRPTEKPQEGFRSNPGLAA